MQARLKALKTAECQGTHLPRQGLKDMGSDFSALQGSMLVDWVSPKDHGLRGVSGEV